MTFTIEYQPKSLAFDEFQQIDQECFPDEPVNQETFQAFWGQDFWAAWESALTGKMLVGYCSAHRKPSFAWIRRIGVSSQHRRRGIGRLLMEKALNHFKKSGLEEVMLYVMQDNLPALRLYEGFGFKIADTSYQYNYKICDNSNKGSNVDIRPVEDVPETEMPELPGQWSDLRTMNHPPEQYVLIFFDKTGKNVGYCRLSPGFPGCFPFVVLQADRNLLPVLDRLREYLLPEKDHLKLTFNDEAIARACEKHGIELHYKLYKMVRAV